MCNKQNNQNRDIDNLRRQNNHLEAQIRALERAKNSGQYHSTTEILESSGLNYDASSGESEAAGGNETPGSAAISGGAAVGESGSGSDTDSGKDDNYCLHYPQRDGLRVLWSRGGVE